MVRKLCSVHICACGMAELRSPGAGMAVATEGMPMTGTRGGDALGVVLLGLIILWCGSVNPGVVQWADSGMFLTKGADGVFFAPELGAQTHPLFHTLSVAVRDAFGAIGLTRFNTFLLVPLSLIVIRLVRICGGSLSAGLFAACNACLVHCVFWIACRVEVYVVNLVLILACYWIVFDLDLRIGPKLRMFLLGVFAGLALSVHQLTLFCVAPLGLYVLWTYRATSLIAGLGLLAGLAPCAPGFVAELHRGRTPLEAARLFLTNAVPVGVNTSGYESSLFRFDRILAGKPYVAIALLSLVGPQTLGLIPPRSARGWVMWVAATVNLVFVLSYDVADRFTFFLPGAALLSVLAWLHIDRWVKQGPLRTALSAAAVLAGPLLFIGVFAASQAGIVRAPANRNVLPVRNDTLYFLTPYLRDTSARHFVDAYDKVAPKGAVVIADETPLQALKSAQTSGYFQGRTLLGCLDYEAWSRSAPATPAYVVRLRPNCEAIGKDRPRPLAIGFYVPPRTPGAPAH
jgi:hypothetical protein